MANIMRLGGGAGGAKGQPLSSLTEGSLVSVLEDGKLVPFYVAKHDYESDLNGTGRTLLVRKDAYGTMAWNSTNVNTYANSTVDTFLNGEYKGKLSSAVNGQIATTLFEYTVGNASATLTSLARSVFLLSHTEFGVSYSGANTEGEAIPVASNVKIAYINGTATRQWTRSPNKNDAANVAYVNTDGGTSGANANIASYAVRPCFTLPANMALNEVPYGDGSWGLADEEVTIDTETATTTAKSGVNYTNGIADLTPAQLHDIAAAISANPKIDKYMGTIYYDKGDVHRKISTGDTQNIDVGGTSYAVNIIGFNHDDLSDGTVYGNPTATGKAGISFQMVDCYGTAYQMHSSAGNGSGWTYCVMRESTLPALKNGLSSDLVSAIKRVTKLTSAGYKSSTINTTADQLFLLSEVEVFGTLTGSFAGEGTQYAYYKAGNSKIKNYNGSAYPWWERSPRNADTTGFCIVMGTGTADFNAASGTLGVAFAYCI